MSQFTNFERLALVMQANSSVGDDYFVNPKLIGELVTSGQDWALNWEYESLDKVAHPLDQAVEETVKIFDMYRHLQASADEIKFDKAITSFPGFDGNNDPHAGVAETIVEKLDRYSDLRGATNNSHTAASLRLYRRMLETYTPLLKAMHAAGSGGYRMLNAGEIDTVLNARLS